MAEDWAAVAKAINARVNELGWLQRELAQRSHVSQAPSAPEFVHQFPVVIPNHWAG